MSRSASLPTRTGPYAPVTPALTATRRPIGRPATSVATVVVCLVSTRQAPGRTPSTRTVGVVAQALRAAAALRLQPAAGRVGTGGLTFIPGYGDAKG